MHVCMPLSLHGAHTGKTLGIVGFGDIGQAAAKCAKGGFGMHVLALRSDPTKVSAHADEVLGPERKSELFARSDFVVCALPGTADTYNYCGAAEFHAMKNSAVFISIGRGVCVDEDALASALTSGEIAGAAVDVFKTEPLPETNPLWDCDNVLLSVRVFNGALLSGCQRGSGWGYCTCVMMRAACRQSRQYINVVELSQLACSANLWRWFVYNQTCQVYFADFSCKGRRFFMNRIY